MEAYELFKKLGWKCKATNQDFVGHWVPVSKDTEGIYFFEGGRQGLEWIEFIYADSYEQSLEFWKAPVQEVCYPKFNYTNIEVLRVLLDTQINNNSSAEYIETDHIFKELGWKCAYFNETVAHWVPASTRTTDCYILESSKPGNQTVSLIYAEHYEQAQDFWHVPAALACEPVFHYVNLENLKTILLSGI